jgi:hypothetical protein
MTIAHGTEVYNVDHGALLARGVTLRASELTAALEGVVGAILRDDAGQKHLTGILTKLATTKFAATNVQRILEQTPALTDWRVGEAIAEAFLVGHRKCEFPWPQGRDLRNLDASPAGADLVGFLYDKTSVRFAFGEAKTSNDASSPPQVMYGRCGLNKQLEALRDDPEVTGTLVRYLAHRKEGVPWRAAFDTAATRFFTDTNDICLFGVLVRDTPPADTDLRSRARSLASHSKKPSIEMRAIYLPGGALATVVTAAKAASAKASKLKAAGAKPRAAKRGGRL